MERSVQIAKDLLKIQAVFFRPDAPFTWASGIKSPVYCDNRLTLTDVSVRSDLEEGLAGLILGTLPGGGGPDGDLYGGHRHAAHYRPSSGPAHGVCPQRRQGSWKKEPN